MFKWYHSTGLLFAFAGLTLGLLACGSSAPTATPTPGPTSTPTTLPEPTSTPVETSQDDDSESPPAYLTEIYKGGNFDSAEDWAEKVSEWEHRRPELPGLSQSIRGFTVGVRMSRQLNRDRKILNDKWKHCVVGFEVAKATNLRTAEYAGWRKEYQDLTDGKPGTRFEEEDYNATVDGAHLFVQGRTSASCEGLWGDRNMPWDRSGKEVDQ